MPISLSCPFCNSAFELAAVPPNRRVPCPRCGEIIPTRGGEDVISSVAEEIPPAPIPDAQPVAAQWARVYWIGIVAVGAIVIAGIVQAWFARRPEPPRIEKKVEIPEVIAPTELSGLKYLRADTNFVVAIQPGIFWMDELARDSGANPTLKRLGVPAVVFETLERAGVPQKSIEQAVFGLAVNDEIVEVPPFILALVLRQPLEDEERFLKALQSRRTSVGDRTLHQVNLGNLPGVLRVSAWKATPTVWVFTNRETELPPPHGGSGPTSPTLRELYRNVFPRTAAVWLVADEADWSKKPSIEAFARFKERQDLLTGIGKVRAVAVGLSFGVPSQQHIAIRAADDSTAETLRNALQEEHAVGTGRDVLLETHGDPAFNLERLAEKVQQTLFP